MPEIINTDQGSEFTAEECPDALAAAISELLADPLARKRMGRRGRERAEQEFSTPVVVRETLALYARLVRP